MRGTWRGLILWTVVAGILAGTSSAQAQGVTPADLVKSSLLTEIRQRGVLRVGMDATYPPMDMVDKDGNLFGFDIDVDKLLAETIGVKLELVNTAWDGIIPALQTGKFDAIINGMNRVPKRALAVAFTDSYIELGMSLGVNKARTPGAKEWKALDRKGKVIVVMLGTTGEFAAVKLFKAAEIRKFQTAPEMVLEVVAGRADAWLWDTPQTVFHVGRNADKTYAIDTPLPRQEAGFAIRQGDPVFLEFLNVFIADLKSSGKHAELYQKWFGNMEWVKSLPPDKKK